MRLVITVGVILSFACLTGCGSPLQQPTAPSGPVSPALTGIVREIDGGPIAGVKLTVLPAGPVTLSDGTGAFSFSHFQGSLVRAEKEGYESRDYGLSASTMNLTMQRMVVVSEGSSLLTQLSPADLPHYVGEPYESDYCRPCKVIRLRADHAGDVKVRLRWPPQFELRLWAHAGAIVGRAEPRTSELTAIVSAEPGDTLLHVGFPFGGTPQIVTTPLTFELTTSVP